jgi:hypothetical protein
MSIVAVAILISFHLKAEASPLEKRIALPFGLVFWCLAIACLAAGLNNYIKTVSRYSRRQALVQSGTGTQLVRIGRLQCTDVAVLFLPGGGADEVTMSGIHGCGDGDCCRLCAVFVDECEEQQITIENFLAAHNIVLYNAMVSRFLPTANFRGLNAIPTSCAEAWRSSPSSSAPPS